MPRSRPMSADPVGVLRERLLPFVENTAEATTACLFAMVQGNLLALTVSHWLIASQTGILAGAATSVAILIARARKPWVISTLLGLVTSIVDYLVHPGMFGPFFLEAVVTGIGAGVLSFIVQWILRKVLERRRIAA